MAIKQISVFLENKPGTLDAMTQVLAEQNIDLRALMLAETKDFGIVRMIVNDAYETATILKDNAFICRMTPVIAVEITDKVGGLNLILKVLKKVDVNIEYMYASLAGRSTGNAYMIFRIEDIAKAEGALGANGFHILDQDGIDAM